MARRRRRGVAGELGVRGKGGAKGIEAPTLARRSLPIKGSQEVSCKLLYRSNVTWGAVVLLGFPVIGYLSPSWVCCIHLVDFICVCYGLLPNSTVLLEK